MLLMEDRLAAGREHMAAGRRDSAGLILEAILDINPGHVEALPMLAEIRVAQGKLEDAVNLAAAACRQAPRDAGALALLARIALLARRPDMVGVAIESGLRLDPDNADLAMLKASLLISSGDFPGAEQRLAAALSIHPAHAGLLSTLAQLYARSGTMAPALRYAQQALAIDPHNTMILGQLGGLLAELGDHQRALPHLEKAHLRDPADPNLAARLGQSLLGIGHLTEAQRLSDRLVALYPEFLPGWQVWTATMIQRGEVDAALARLGQVTKAHSERVQALLLLAGAYRIAGRADDALRLVETLIPRLSQLDTDMRSAALTLIRDCCMTTGAFDRLREIMLPQSSTDQEAGDAVARAAEPVQFPIVIDPRLSPLEIIPLLRFCRPAHTSVSTARPDPVELRGPGSAAELVALVPGLAFAANDVPRDEPVIQRIEAAPLTSLLLDRRQDLAVAAIPYVRPSAGRLDIWQRSLAALPRPLLGISWDEGRPSLMLDDLAPLLKDFTGTLVSLCWDGGRSQLSAWPAVIDAGRHVATLDDVAAIIAHLDAVIGPDSLPLHLAGAMGIPGALLTQPNFAWYWHAAESRSAWYPSIELHKTDGIGHWATRIGDLEGQIAEFVRKIGAGRETRS